MNTDKFIKELPEDVNVLKQTIVNYHNEIKMLQEQIKLLQHRKFGKKSEQTNSPQLELFDEPEEILTPKAEEISIEVKSYTKKVTRNKSLPKTLPKKQINYDLRDEDKKCACGDELRKFGEDKYEQLEYIPAQINVIEHIKSKYSCKSCETVKTATMPKQPLPKSIASPSLLAQIITSKYVDHLPLYRQESIFSRIGIDLQRSTVASWIFKCANLLSPLVEILKKEIVSSNYVKADETTVNVLSEEAAINYMWVFMANMHNKPIVVFEYHSSRCAKAAEDFLKDFAGYLQTDGYSGYTQLKKDNVIVGLGCLAHARRKFFEITKAVKSAGAAHIGLKYINDLYKIEKDAKEKKLTFSELKIIRDKKSKPILLEFKFWLEKTISRVLPKSALYKAVHYSLNNWQELSNYCLEGYLEIDNNSIERMIKPFACGRKNWMFSGNTKGAKASAILYSLIQTCKLNNVDPFKYLKATLIAIPNINSEKELANLLPQNYT